ncbi:choice-of-anchor X domain-containing protein [Celerinatantimonas sp. YJH-8]|uniref:choice-of-anchor X domain-containing protein n=1 Tax=Celerinatantimonas sp. YJH-8 TaxID=3228714 RepID=UPI0038C903DD
MNWCRRWRVGVVLLASLVMGPAWAQIADVYRNHDIPLIDNRFRIDPEVDQVSFLLHRKPGSPAAILVRPDGSKIYPWDLPDGVEWFESHEMDIVTIHHPMPGPWQALVEYEGQNAVQILSSVNLKVDPFPLHLYAGERLPLKASLLYKEKPLKLGPYMDGTLLHVTLNSSNSSDEDNFAFAHTKLAVLRDDGKEFDGYPEDGIYTGYLELEVPAGKYSLSVTTQNDVFTRGYQQLILVSHQPFKANLSAPRQDVKAKIQLQLDKDEIQPDSLVLDGTISSNLGWKKHFELRSKNAPANLTFELPTPTQEGTYQVQAMAYATTLGGRPLVMRMPAKSFVVLPPPPPPVVKPVEVVVVPEKSHVLLWVIIGGVVLLLMLGGGVFGYIWLKKRKAFNQALEKAKALEELSRNAASSELEMQAGPLPPGQSEEVKDTATQEPSLTPADDAVPGLDEQPDLTKEKGDDAPN